MHEDIAMAGKERILERKDRMKVIITPILKGMTVMFAFITATLMFLAVLIWEFSFTKAGEQWKFFMDGVAKWEPETCIAVWIVGIMYVVMCVHGIQTLCHVQK